MTPEKIAEWRGMCAEATPGPWRDVKSVARVVRDRQGAGDQTGSVDIADCGDMKDKELVPFNAVRWRADAKLIAAARTALPAALDEIERLKDCVLAANREVAFLLKAKEHAHEETSEAEHRTMTSQREVERLRAGIQRVIDGRYSCTEDYSTALEIILDGGSL